MRQLRLSEIAIVQELHVHEDDDDTNNHACTVVLRDSEIVLKKVPVSSGRLGMVAIPDIDDVVLIQFINGDINAPIIVGSLYNEVTRPPLSTPGSAVLHLPEGAGEGDGARLELNAADELSLKINIGGALTLELKDDDPVVMLDVADGGASITIERDGTVQLESQGNIEMKGGGDINIEASGQLNMKGSVINLN